MAARVSMLRCSDMKQMSTQGESLSRPKHQTTMPKQTPQRQKDALWEKRKTKRREVERTLRDPTFGSAKSGCTAMFCMTVLGFCPVTCCFGTPGNLQDNPGRYLQITVAAGVSSPWQPHKLWRRPRIRPVALWLRVMFSTPPSHQPMCNHHRPVAQRLASKHSCQVFASRRQREGCLFFSPPLPSIVSGQDHSGHNDWHRGPRLPLLDASHPHRPSSRSPGLTD